MSKVENNVSSITNRDNGEPLLVVNDQSATIYQPNEGCGDCLPLVGCESLSLPLDDNVNTDAADYTSRIVDKLVRHRLSFFGKSRSDSTAFLSDTLRDLPLDFRVKRLIRMKIGEQSMDRRPSKFKLLCAKLGVQVHALGDQFECCGATMRAVERNCGSETAAYVRCVRDMCALNVLLAVLMMLFIVGPQMLLMPLVPFSNSTVPFKVVDLLTFDGALRTTVLHYGFYTNATIYSVSNSFPYCMPVAYCSVHIVAYIGCFIVFSIRAGARYKRHFIESKFRLSNTSMCSRILLGWDYGIATTDAAVQKSRAIWSVIQDALKHRQLRNDEQQLRRRSRRHLSQFTITLLADLLVVFVVVSMACLLWFLISYVQGLMLAPSIGQMKRLRPSEQRAHVLTAWPSILVALVVALFPVFVEHLQKVVNYQRYVMSCFLMNNVLIGVLLAFHLRSVKPWQCWEMLISQQMYRLLACDTLLALIEMVGVRWLIAVRLFGRAYPFNLQRHHVGLLHVQAILWAGLFFAPLLAVLAAVRLALEWFWLTHQMTTPRRVPYRATRYICNGMVTVFEVLNFVNMVLVLAMFAYIWLKVAPSAGCGPFREYAFFYKMLSRGMFNLERITVIRLAVEFLLKPAIVALILLLLGLKVYYARIECRTHKRKVRFFRDLISWQAKDKRFLLNVLAQLASRTQTDVDQADATGQCADDISALLGGKMQLPSPCSTQDRLPTKQTFDVAECYVMDACDDFTPFQKLQ